MNKSHSLTRAFILVISLLSLIQVKKIHCHEVIEYVDYSDFPAYEEHISSDNDGMFKKVLKLFGWKNDKEEKTVYKKVDLNPVVYFEEGRGLFNGGVIETIGKFMGWNKKDEIPAYTHSIDRRPEMLPFQYTQYRRNIQVNKPRPNPLRVDKKSFPNSLPYPNTRKTPGKPSNTVLAKYFGFNSFPAKKQYIPQNRLPTAFQSNSNEFGQSNPSIKTQYGSKNVLNENGSLKSSQGKTLQTVPDKIQGPVAEKNKNALNVQKEILNQNNTNDIYYHIAKEKYQSSQQINNSKHTKQNASPSIKNESVHAALREQKPINARQKVSPHPYPFFNPTFKPQPQSINRIPEEIRMHHSDVYQPYDSVPMQSQSFPIVAYENPHKEKEGLFESVKSVANNFFNNFFSKSSSFPKKRRQQYFAQILSPNQVAQGAASNVPTYHSPNGIMTPSPQQGMISENAFQPVFVPSQSVGNEISSDNMKPLIIPQERIYDMIPEPSRTEPELISFF